MIHPIDGSDPLSLDSYTSIDFVPPCSNSFFYYYYSFQVIFLGIDPMILEYLHLISFIVLIDAFYLVSVNICTRKTIDFNLCASSPIIILCMIFCG